MIIGKATGPWNEAVALFICLGIGFGWGLVACKFRNREFGPGSSVYEDEATALLFTKRLMVVATCLAGPYFIWQMAKSI